MADACGWNDTFASDEHDHVYDIIHVRFKSLPTSSLKWAQQSHKTKGRDIKIKDTNKCEAFGAVGESRMRWWNK